MIPQNNDLLKAKSHLYSCWVSASAGTGKTTLLTDRIINLLLSGIDPESILCITFTRAAKSEMQSRINDKLLMLSNSHESKIADYLKSLRGVAPNKDEISKAKNIYYEYISSSQKIKIYTIHGFCQHLLQKFPFEAKIKPSFKVSDDLNYNKIIDKIISSKDFIEKLPPILRNNFSVFSIIDLLKETTSIISNNPQIDITEYIDAYKKILNYEYLKNFTLDSLKKNLKTFNISALFDDDLCLKISEFISKNESLILFDELKNNFLTLKGEPRKKVVGTKIKNSNDIDKIQDFIYNVNNFIEANRILEINTKLIEISSIISEQLNEYKNKKNLLTYDDLIIYANNLLENSDMREWIKFKLDGGIKHILIDESQDTSLSQWKIIENLTSDFFAGYSDSEKNRSIFVVGDIKQSIYSFQGARPDLFHKTKERIKIDATNSNNNFLEINLDKTYRLPKLIYDFVDNIFSEIEFIEKPPKLECSRDGYSSIEIFEIEAADEKKEFFYPLPSALNEFVDDEKKLALKISEFIKEKIDSGLYIESKNRNVKPEDFMILVQKRSSLNSLLQENLQKLGVNVAGLDRIILNENIAVLDLISAAKYCLFNDKLNLASLLKSPIFKITDSEFLAYTKSNHLDLDQLILDKPELREKLSYIKYLYTENKTDQFFLKLISNFDLLNYYESLSLFDSVDALKGFVEKMKQLISFNEYLSVAEFVEIFENNEIELKRDLSLINAVKILTIHGSKGLEAPFVILADSCRLSNSMNNYVSQMNIGDAKIPIYEPKIQFSQMVNISKSDRIKSELSEYYRLLYVALTRAKDHLAIFGFNSNYKEDSWYNLCLSYAKKNFAKNDASYYLENSAMHNDNKLSIDISDNDSEIYNRNFKFNYSKNLIERKEFSFDTEITSFGDKIHKFIEVALTQKLDFNNLNDKLNLNFQNNDYKKAKTIISKIAKDKFFTELYNLDFSTEVEIAYLDGDIKNLYRIDLLVFKENEIFIVDYKTGDSKSEKFKSKYQNQLNTYKEIIQKIYDTKTVVARIYWLESGSWDNV